MKFQNPSFKFFLNGRTHARTHRRTDKPKAICSPLFQSWGHKNLTLKYDLDLVFYMCKGGNPKILNLEF